MDTAGQIVKLMETYRGRDKVMRLMTYVSMFLAGERQSSLSRKFRVISKELSACRTVLRLFDDLPMLLSNIKYGFGEKEKSVPLRCLDLASNVCNQLYYPVEHIAWLADKHILSASSAKWWTACLAFWAFSLTLEIIKCVIRIYLCRLQQHRLRKQKSLDKPESGYEISEQNKEISTRLRQLKDDERVLLWSLLQSMFDLLNAGNWQPKGFLWSGYFSASKCGLFGIASSLVMICKLWPTSEKKLL